MARKRVSSKKHNYVKTLGKISVITSAVAATLAAALKIAKKKDK